MMAKYKDVEIGAEVAPLIRHMGGVDDTRESLQRLQGVWDHLAMLGEFSGTGIEIGSVRSAFEGLTSRLIDQLAAEARRKVVSALESRAQVAIDILVRNLFERTADIGFLATDDALRRFADNGGGGPTALVERLREYQQSYTVYDDVILLDAAGRVLARLARCEVEATGDGFVAEALRGAAAYVEAFGRFALLPGRDRSLVYAQRVLPVDGGTAVGVLCLSFRFDDECRRIFDGLRRDDDWTVLALVDADGQVIASSDALQVPMGLAIGSGADPGSRLIRFGGRRWLAACCAPQAYQGYAGPAWRGLALVPVDLAFDAGDGPAPSPLPAAQLAALSASPRLHSEALRAIAPAAAAIEAELQRSVWNGHVTLCSARAGPDSAFSKALLREIGRTGARTREVFTHAIAGLNQTVVSALLDDTAARAALAIDILDRNLYERANDCRWWALTDAFRQQLAGGAIDTAGRAALTATLQTIHGLYTVYANLLLFDREGRVVAVSREDGQAAPGRRLGDEWVARTLALADTQAWAVSAFEASPLYGGRPTCIYTAAVRAPADVRRVVGGIAIVFDAAPQFEAMLDDAQPRGENGAVREGAVSLFVDAGGRVLASAEGGSAVGDMLPGGAALAAADAPGIVEHDGRLWAFAARRSTGYREYRGGRDPQGTRVSALCLVPLAGAPDGAAVPPPAPAPPAAVRRAGGGDRVELAAFRVAGEWYALRGSDVVEAIGGRRVLSLPTLAPCIRGSVMHGGRPVLVVDLARLLGAESSLGDGGQIVVVRGGEGYAGFGLCVDALGETSTVDAGALQSLGGATSLIESIVRPGAAAGAHELLKLLSLRNVAAATFGVRAPAAAAVQTA